ncbi:MAG: hypothetical protein [Cressdnaviricota sp.]|nr:MAG: hypothetical protein [Cressdnaviricota sp.]
MPSVRNVTDAPSPDSSNVVLFEMMMHYKQEAEHLAKRLEEEEQQKREYMEARLIEARRANQLEEELDDAIYEIRAYEVANRRGAEIITRKHEAGMRMLEAFDDLMGYIVVTEQYHRLRGEAHTDVVFVKERADAAQERMDLASAQFMTGWYVPDRDEDLTTDEIIDLTGDTTDEDEEMEV